MIVEAKVNIPRYFTLPQVDHRVDLAAQGLAVGQAALVRSPLEEHGLDHITAHPTRAGCHPWLQRGNSGYPA